MFHLNLLVKYEKYSLLSREELIMKEQDLLNKL